MWCKFANGNVTDTRREWGKACECGLAADRVPEEGTGPVPEHPPPSLKVSPGGWWRGGPGVGSGGCVGGRGGSRRRGNSRAVSPMILALRGWEGAVSTPGCLAAGGRILLSGLRDWGGRTGWSSPRRHGLVQTPDFSIRIAGTSAWLLPGFFHRAGSASWVRPEPVVRLGALPALSWWKGSGAASSCEQGRPVFYRFLPLACF